MSNPSYVLRVERKNQPPADQTISAARIVIGREAGDIALQDPGASGKHAEVLFQEGIVTFRDLGSTNGTWLGKQRIKEQVWQPGVALTIGDSRLTLVEVQGAVTLQGTLVMSGPRAEPRAEPRPGTVVQAKPMPAGNGMATSRRPLVIAGAAIGALVLAALLLRGNDGPSGGGDAAGGGGAKSGVGGGVVATPSLTGTKEVTVKAVWFRGPLGPQASGGTSPSTVRISPNTKDGASVGVLEEFAGGAGNQWRTATWLAAFSASQLTGRNLTDHEFLVRTGGHIDGPSAGMLMTATMVAMLRGKTPRADTTMTGTINPDGSAGPVGGIVQKMEGASKDGIKRFGFPMGARNHQDLRTGRSVDLFDAGKEFGLEVREIKDVFGAYEFLTDDTLARATALGEGEMELDSETSTRLRSKNEKWTARLRSDLANLNSVARGLGELEARIKPLAAMAETAFKEAQGYERSDFLASAFESYVQAAVYMAMTKDAARFLKSYTQNDMQDVIAQVQAAQAVKGQLSAMLGEVSLQSKRKTIGGQINALRAYQSAVVANAFTNMGDGSAAAAQKLLDLQKENKLDEKGQQALPEMLFQAISYYAVGKTMLDVAEDQKDFGSEEGKDSPVPTEVLGRLAAAYGSAAGAVLQYLESLTLESEARDAGIDKATAQNRFAANDVDYLFARSAASIAEGGPGKKDDTVMLRLAAGSGAFLKGASLINKYYSLDGQRSATGELQLTNRKALSAQLDLARQLAREAASTAKQRTGFVPVASRIAYQLGIAKREGDDEEKLAALEAFWESAFWSQLAGRSVAAK
jgi:uncharacterized protein